METSLKQAAILAVISSQPGITGPELLSRVGKFVPQIQFPQYVGRLRKRGLIATERCAHCNRKIEFRLTKAGEDELAHALELSKFVAKQTRKKT